MPTAIKIFILHNDRPTAMMDGYAEGDSLTLVYSDEKHLLDAEVSLDYIYAENQWVDDDHRPWYDDARSVSKGDVIVLHDKAYAVGSIGFTEVQVNVEGLV